MPRRYLVGMIFVVVWLLAAPAHALGLATVGVSDTSVVEGDDATDMRFIVSRSGDSTSEITLRYATRDGTAIAGTDYIARDGLLTIPSGAVDAAIDVPIIGNKLFQPNRTFALDLTDIVNVNGPPVTFAAASAFAVPAAARVGVGDFNRDGKLDIVAATTSAPNGVSILINTTAPGSSMPSFAPEVDFLTGAGASDIVVADFNGDGAPDLAVTNLNGTTVSVLLNTTVPGSATPAFAPYIQFEIGPFPSVVTAGDLNGDGKPDLVVSNAGGFSGTVMALVNTTPPGASVPSFADKVDVVICACVGEVAIADLNRDGMPDLVITNGGATAISIVLNTTSPGATIPSFAPQQDFATGAVPAIVGPGPSAVAVTDINGDGLLDIVTANRNSPTFSVLINTSSPGAPIVSFASHVDLDAGGFPIFVAVSDLNGDGKPDLVLGSPAQGAISAFINSTPSGAATPAFGARSEVPANFGPVSIAVADFDGDGRPDVVVGNGFPNRISVLMNTTVMAVTPPTHFADPVSFASGAFPIDVATGDFNVDGKLDIAVVNSHAGTVSVLLNTATPGGGFQFAPATDIATGRTLATVQVADFNGDGRPDLAITSDIGTVSVALNTTAAGAASASFAGQADFATDLSSGDIATGDLNGDGKPDIAVVNEFPHSVSVLLNTTAPGATTASFASAMNFAVGVNALGIAIGDVNNDGRPDIVATSATSVDVLINTTALGATSPSFADAAKFSASIVPGGVVIADFNGDGLMDIAVTDAAAGIVSILLNTTAPGAASPAFAPRVDFTSGSGSRVLAVGDINGDGKPDLATNVSVLFNRTSPQSLTPEFLTVELPRSTSANGVALADFDGDGHLDVARADANDNVASVFRNLSVVIDKATATGTILDDDTRAVPCRPVRPQPNRACPDVVPHLQR